MEVKSIISEKDSVLKRQGSVIDTLTDELGVLKAREQVETRTLISEITLLEENLSHLQAQFDQVAVIHEQAENRLELALREQQSLEVGLKQIRYEREHCKKRMPKVQNFLSDVQKKLEAKIGMLKTPDSCSTEIDQFLQRSANMLKDAVEDILSYTYVARRKHLRIQTLRSSSSDTGEPEYFVTLNDYEYQLFKESISENGKARKRDMKAKAASQQRFVC